MYFGARRFITKTGTFISIHIRKKSSLLYLAFSIKLQQIAETSIAVNPESSLDFDEEKNQVTVNNSSRYSRK